MPEPTPQPTVESFAEFYLAVHGCAAFEWQRRLAGEVLDPQKGWPGVIRAPTASGKTSVLDIAVFELAAQAHRKPEDRTAARRLCFVVDRKLIVDEATEHAATIRKAIIDAAEGKRSESVLKNVAASLKSLAANPNEPLRVVRLRGGVYRDDGWAADPLTPTILISTVDQIGSRLLFRGYGASPHSRAMHAGLLAFDTRIILDEAHLSTVFATTLDGREVPPNHGDISIPGLRQYQRWAEQQVLPVGRCIALVRMSATAGEGGRTFDLLPQERDDPGLKLRLQSSKPAHLVEVSVEAVKKEIREKQPRVARQLDRRNREKLVDAAVVRAKELALFEQDGQPNRPRVVGLVFNRVASARQAFDALRQPVAGEPPPDAILLTGRIRPFDRDRLLSDWLPRIRAGRDAQADRPLFVVATQTVEVGANIDFDALITEAAPLDALRQRFGRLHRIPDRPVDRPRAVAAIFVCSDQSKDSSADPIYGKSTAATWQWLQSKANSAQLSRGERSKKAGPAIVDFGVNALDAMLPRNTNGQLDHDALRPLLAPQPEAPLLFPAHLDAWVQTDPMPDPDPDVAPFLHGPAAGAADVQIVWRADLKPGNRAHWQEIVSLMPPRSREALPVPLHEARDWLRDAATADIADVEGVAGAGEMERGKARRALRWRGPNQPRPGDASVGPHKIRPGDTIVVPALYGGADEFGWHGKPRGKDQPPVADVADQCLTQLVASYPQDAFARPKIRLRLHPALFGLLILDDAEKSALARRIDNAAGLLIAEADATDDLRGILCRWSGFAQDASLKSAAEGLAKRASDLVMLPYPSGDGIVVSANIPIALTDHRLAAHDLEYDEPEGDGVSTIRAGRAVLLSEHTEAVRRMVEHFARTCALSKPLQAALATAAQWHDAGKRDRRFQALLHGSELRAFAAIADDGQPGKGPLAKSGRERAGRTETFGYPKGQRHEFVSVRLFEQAAQEGLGGPSPIPDADLIKLLIGTHHGRGRAFAPVVRDHDAVQVRMAHCALVLAVSSDHALHRLDSGWVDLFWRMVRRHGWWGLAYIEALLITADRLVSAIEQREQCKPVVAVKARASGAEPIRTVEAR